MSYRSVEEILQDLRGQVSRCGEHSFKRLIFAFDTNDSHGNGKFDKEEFTLMLEKVGLFLKTSEISQVFNHFDKDKTKMISKDDFMKGMAVPLNTRREDLIKLVYTALQRQGKGKVIISAISNAYIAKKHPKVVSGEQNEEQVFLRFLGNFEKGQGLRGDQEVSWEEFKESFTGISNAYPDNDDAFCLMMERTWGIQEQKGAVDTMSEPVENAKKVLREKVRQKTSSSASEMDTLYKAFKHFDANNSGLLTQSEFNATLKRFGIILKDDVVRALFMRGKGEEKSTLDYDEFCIELYNGFGATRSHKNFFSKTRPNMFMGEAKEKTEQEYKSCAMPN